MLINGINRIAVITTMRLSRIYFIPKLQSIFKFKRLEDVNNCSNSSEFYGRSLYY